MSPKTPQLPLDQQSIAEFWADIALQTVDWMHPWSSVLTGDLYQGNCSWFAGAQLNVSANCLDRHLPHKANHPAIIWEGDAEEQERVLTFAQLHEEVCKMSNLLKQLKIKKGDVVSIYLPMIPEAAIAMLACARIGATHSVIFAGFSAHALRQRLEASQCGCLITADCFPRAGKTIAMKDQVDEATQGLNLTTLVIKNSTSPIGHRAEKEFWWHELKDNLSSHCPPEAMDAEDPLFILPGYALDSTID